MYVIKATEYFIFSVFTLPQAHWKKTWGLRGLSKVLHTPILPHKCLEFSESPSGLDKAILTMEKSVIA